MLQEVWIVRLQTFCPLEQEVGPVCFVDSPQIHQTELQFSTKRLKGHGIPQNKLAQGQVAEHTIPFDSPILVKSLMSPRTSQRAEKFTTAQRSTDAGSTNFYSHKDRCYQVKDQCL